MMHLKIHGLNYIKGIIKNIYRHNENVISLIIRLKNPLKINPGQFVMLWIPNLEEIPLSPSYSNKHMIRLTVMKRGETTSTIHKLNKGDIILVRGPYGKGFKLTKQGRYLLIGGGYGAAPIIYVAHKLANTKNEIVYIEGVKTAKQALFIEEAKALGLNTTLVTEDGTSKLKGYVTDYVEKIAKNYNYILACGPEPMLKKIARISINTNINCQLSFEAMIKCGIGLCGSCELGQTGYMVCRDGPVFNIKTIKNYI